jgi:hypothetical protein
MAETEFTVKVSVEPAPAAGAQWNADGTADVAGMVVKAQDELRYTLTVAYPADKPDASVAADGFRDFASKSAVRDAAWNYLTKSRQVGLRHEDGTEGAGEVVESFLWPGDDWTVKAADGTEHVIKQGDWLVGIVWSPQAWAMVKSGEIGGVSMQGRAVRRTPTAEAVASLRS